MTYSLAGWTLVFDLDGTLAETAPDLHGALNQVLDQAGFGPVPLSAIRAMVGDGAKALIRKGYAWHNQTVSEDDIDAVHWPRFMDHYLANISRHSHLFDGAEAALTELKAAGATLAVCTNKAQTLAEAVLQDLGVTVLFSAIVGGDAVPDKKPSGAHILATIARADGNPHRAIMVGDSQTDERAARDAKLPFIFVPFGYGGLSGEPFERLLIVDHWNDMETAVGTLTKSA